MWHGLWNREIHMSFFSSSTFTDIPFLRLRWTQKITEELLSLQYWEYCYVSRPREKGMPTVNRKMKYLNKEQQCEHQRKKTNVSLSYRFFGFFFSFRWVRAWIRRNDIRRIAGSCRGEGKKEHRIASLGKRMERNRELILRIKGILCEP